MNQSDQNRITEALLNIIDGNRIFCDEKLSRHTSFRIGGPASFFVLADDEYELADLLKFCADEHLKYFIIGNGSNILASDDGFDGLIIRLSGDFNKIDFVDENTQGTCVLTAGAGSTLASLSAMALKKGFTGLEFAGGIPGSVGGGIFMNAGAYGGELKDSLISVRAMDKNGNIRDYTKEEADMKYRHSRFSESGEIILRASFRLSVHPRIQIRTLMDYYKTQRALKQPLDKPSAGSTFKRPENAFAGKLIEEAGLKGYRVGDAAVSEKHAGFVVNLGKATSSDVEKLINDVREKVKENSGIMLEPEVRFLK